jgi:Fur family ferric uptake transcriptional regulator
MSTRPQRSRRTRGPSADEARSILKRHGLRVTAARVAVLSRLTESPHPVSHADLVTAMAGDVCDKATIYRALIDLVEAGLALRTDLGDHVWRFERRDDGAPHEQQHPHLVCVDCGDVSCLPDVRVKIVPAAGRETPGGDGVAVQLKGHCERCL